MITGDPLLPDQEEILLPSYVVHASVDPDIPLTAKTAVDEDDEDPDRVITNARQATTADGLLSLTELGDFFSHIPKLRSAYDEGLEQIPHLQGIPTFGRRVTLPPTRHGRWEPEYTSYTHYWKAVLGQLR